MPSLPSRGVWIEIGEIAVIWANPLSLPSRGVWIEIGLTGKPKSCCGRSLPSRGVWIEILVEHIVNMKLSVAPLAGSVD